MPSDYRPWIWSSGTTESRWGADLDEISDAYLDWKSKTTRRRVHGVTFEMEYIVDMLDGECLLLSLPLG
jgi:hypothetical protein